MYFRSSNFWNTLKNIPDKRDSQNMADSNVYWAHIRRTIIYRFLHHTQEFSFGAIVCGTEVPNGVQGRKAPRRCLRDDVPQKGFADICFTDFDRRNDQNFKICTQMIPDSWPFFHRERGKLSDILHGWVVGMYSAVRLECGRSYYSCPSSGECVRWRFYCDGRCDCLPDCSDEDPQRCQVPGGQNANSLKGQSVVHVADSVQLVNLSVFRCLSSHGVGKWLASRYQLRGNDENC